MSFLLLLRRRSMKYPNGYFKPKLCKTCSVEFTPEAPSQFYCGIKCRGRNSYYVRNYGFNEEELAKKKAAQDYKCYLCLGEGFVMNNKIHHERLAVDHCHESGEVRKLLCHNCNRALGLFKDNPELLRKAAKYIEDHKEGATTIP